MFPCKVSVGLKFGDNPLHCWVLYTSKMISGSYDEADKIWKEINERGLEKVPGETWLEMDGNIVSFKAHDQLLHVPEYKDRILDKVFACYWSK